MMKKMLEFPKPAFTVKSSNCQIIPIVYVNNLYNHHSSLLFQPDKIFQEVFIAHDTHYVIQALLLFGIKAQYAKPLYVTTKRSFSNHQRTETM